MNNVFNSELEIALRFLLIINAIAPIQASMERLIAYDFMTTYGKHFGVADYNLHGDGNCFSELAYRREVAKKAIGYLVRNNLINVCTTDNGYCYNKNRYSSKVLRNIETIYSARYLEILEKVKNIYGRKQDKTLVSIINQKAIAEGRS